MKIDTGGPAAPMPEHLINAVETGSPRELQVIAGLIGKTWLDECAMMAMQALISNSAIDMNTNDRAARIVNHAYFFAAEMLAEKRRLEGGS